MNTLIKISAVGILCTGASISHAKAESILPIQSGIIQCAVLEPKHNVAEPRENIMCVFNTNDGSSTMYNGHAIDEHIDIGEIKGGVMRWAVLTTADPTNKISGEYGSVDAPTELGLPQHAKVLIRNSGGQTILQPDVTPGDGVLNFAVGITSLGLTESD